MANANGKSARAKVGRRAALKRLARHRNPTKQARWAEREEQRKQKGIKL